MLLEQITLDNFTELEGFRWTGPEQPSDDDDLARRFLAFCRSKPADERYEFWVSKTCPITQFGRYAGLITVAQGFGWDDDLCDLHHRCDAPLRSHPWQFSALADRLEAALDGES